MKNNKYSCLRGMFTILSAEIPEKLDYEEIFHYLILMSQTERDNPTKITDMYHHEDIPHLLNCLKGIHYPLKNFITTAAILDYIMENWYQIRTFNVTYKVLMDLCKINPILGKIEISPQLIKLLYGDFNDDEI